MTSVTRNLCEGLPKVELHAHLNGSVRDSTLRELAHNDPAITEDAVHQLGIKGMMLAAERQMASSCQ
jgi:adenosine deaminase